MKRHHLNTLLVTLIALASGAHGAATNATVSAATTRRAEFEAFKLITERNIFNGNRSGQRVVARSTPQRTVRVDSFTLVGTLSSEGGDVAFFDGSESGYRKALKLESQIAGFVLKEIWPAGVKLVEGTNEIALRVGTALRREDEGYWRYAEPGSYASSAGSSTTSSSYSRSRGESGDRDRDRSSSSRSSESALPAADASEILRKLMEKREKENQ